MTTSVTIIHQTPDNGKTVEILRRNAAGELTPHGLLSPGARTEVSLHDGDGGEFVLREQGAAARNEDPVDGGGNADAPAAA